MMLDATKTTFSNGAFTHPSWGSTIKAGGLRHTVTYPISSVRRGHGNLSTKTCRTKVVAMSHGRHNL